MATAITGTNIYLGDARDAQKAKALYSAVLNVAFEINLYPPPNNYNKIGLIDGVGNSEPLFNSAVLALDGLVKSHDNVLIHCIAGSSRSPSVLAAWWGWRHNNRSVDDILNMLAKLRPCVSPRSELVGLAQNFLYSVAPYMK